MYINKVLNYYYRAYNRAASNNEIGRSVIDTFKCVMRAEKNKKLYDLIRKILFRIACGPLYWPNTFPTAADEATAGLLYSIVRLIRPDIAVEIGTAKGNTAIAIGQALEDNKKGILYTIDPEEQEIVHIAIKKSKLKERIKYMIGFSTDVIPKMNFQKLDFVFIDGDHKYENVLKDFNLVKDLIRDGGIIVFHDTNLNLDEFNGPKKIIEQILSKDSSFEILKMPTLSGADNYGNPALSFFNNVGVNPVGLTICKKKDKLEFNSSILICPICNFSGIFNKKEIFNDFNLYRCDNCFVNFWLPLKYPGKDFYEESYMFDIIEERKPAWYHKQFLNNPVIDKGRLIDIGCGQGEFLNALSQKTKFDFFGIDIAKRNVEFIRKKYKLKNIYNEDIENFIKKKDIPKFDVVTIFEVIEHISDPKEFLNKVKKIMKVGGYIVLSTPNGDRFGGTKEDWDYPPNHLFHWNKKSITIFLEQNGFNVEKIIMEPFSKDFFFIRGVFSFKLMKYLRRKMSHTLPEKGGNIITQRPKDPNAIFNAINLFAKIKNYLLNILLIPLEILLRILGFKYWDMYIVAKLK